MGTFTTGADTASLTSYFFGGAYETRSDGTTLKYYSFVGQMVAMRDGTGLKYLLSDHLGSLVAITDVNGSMLSQQRYLPFGGERTIPDSPITNTDYGYTGQRSLDPGMGGLMDYRARFFSPHLGRFLQPDSIVPNMANPQDLNRYSYVNNGPINSNDPTGHDLVDKIKQKKSAYGKHWKQFSKAWNRNGSLPTQNTALTDYGQYFACGDDPECQDWARRTLRISNWEYGILSNLYSHGGSDSVHGVNYILANNIHITVGSLPFNMDKNLGAWFNEGSNTLVLKKGPYSLEKMPDNWGLSLVIHEALHIEQGKALSHSKLGEMKAWQAQFRVLSNYQTLGANEQAVLDAQTLEQYKTEIRDHWPGYWFNGKFGLYTYPDEPHSVWWLWTNAPMHGIFGN